MPLVFWIGVYLVFQRQFYGEDLSVGTTVKAVASGDPFLQLYFLFIVAGLTALTPVLRKLIEHSTRRELDWLTGAALGFGLLEHAFREFGGGGGFNAVTRFLPYVGYYLAGYVLRTAEVTEWTQRLSRRLFFAGWLATALGSAALAARYGWTANGNFLYDYLSPTVMMMSLAAFAAARSWQPVRLSDQPPTPVRWGHFRRLPHPPAAALSAHAQPGPAQWLRHRSHRCLGFSTCRRGLPGRRRDRAGRFANPGVAPAALLTRLGGL